MTNLKPSLSITLHNTPPLTAATQDSVMDVDGQEETTPSTSTTTTGGATPTTTGAAADEPKPKPGKKRSAKVKKEPESDGAGSTGKDSADNGIMRYI